MTTEYLLEVLDSGEIVASTTYVRGMPENPIQGGKLVRATIPYSPGEYFYQNGNFLPLGKIPSENHLFNYQTKKWEVNLNKVEQEALRKRNQLLSESDWTQLPDVPTATQQMWQSYRQALRDITDQENYPLDVVWPTSPKE